LSRDCIKLKVSRRINPQDLDPVYFLIKRLVERGFNVINVDIDLNRRRAVIEFEMGEGVE